MTNQTQELLKKFPMPEGEQPVMPDGEMPIWNGIDRSEIHAAWYKDVYRVWMKALNAHEKWERAEQLHIVAKSVARLVDDMKGMFEETPPEKTIVVMLGIEYLKRNGTAKGLFGSLFG